MFVQVIQGRTSDEEGLRAASQRWVKELASDATGWLGSTLGVRAAAVSRTGSPAPTRFTGQLRYAPMDWNDTLRPTNSR